MKSFTQLVGTTTASDSPGSFCDLSQNNSATNVARGKSLINTQHRYYLQKYFDNERTYTTTTIGAQALTLTGVLTTAAVSGTLSSAWTPQTCHQLVVFSNSEQRTVTFTQGSTLVSWDTGLTSGATASIQTIGVQFYPIPANVSKIKNSTVTVGQLVYTPAPVQSIQEWTMLNALPYTSNITAYFYIYNNQVGFFPIPSSSGQIITFNYKSRVADMTYSDYGANSGTISVATAGSNLVTGSGTAWVTTGTFPTNTDLSYANLMIRIDPPTGDGLWYPIQRFTSGTALTLSLPIVNANAITAATYTIGQFPILTEDFQDLLVYSSLAIYYSSISKDADKFKMFDDLTKKREKLMEAYLSNKSISVDLGRTPFSNNPNLFIYAQP